MFFNEETRQSQSVGSAPVQAAMEKVALDELRLLDLRGNPVTLRNYFQERLLLIFLRHLA
jgi:hypothetical protein